MDKIYLGTNWKMHKTINETELYLKELNKNLNNIDFNKIKLFVIPPYTSLNKARKELVDSNILLGAQNMHWKREGAYTGEISPLMLDEIGVDIVELGHSERRQYYNENNIDINKKAKTALDFNFTPLICVGENYEAKKYGISEEMIRKQLKIIFNNIKREEAKKLLIAYEPVWAIGEKGEPAKPEYAEKIHILIRSYLEEKYDNMTSKNIPLIYGGSVNNENALKFLTRTNIDGLFIGRAAWDVESFLNIIHKINFFKYNS